VSEERRRWKARIRDKELGGELGKERRRWE